MCICTQLWGRVWLSENGVSASQLTHQELRDLGGHFVFLSHDERMVYIHNKVEDAALSETEKAELSQSLKEFSGLFNNRLNCDAQVKHTIGMVCLHNCVFAS